MNDVKPDTFRARRTLAVAGATYDYYALAALAEQGHHGVGRLPMTLKILLENLLRGEDGETVTSADILAVLGWLKEHRSDHEIAFRPGRVLMQDFTGVPAVVDLAAMRDALARAGGDPALINPQIPVDLVIDHSVMVDAVRDSRSIWRQRRHGDGSAIANVIPSYAGGNWPFATSAWSRQGPASVTRSTSSTWRARCGARSETGAGSPTPTRCSAPTATPP